MDDLQMSERKEFAEMFVNKMNTVNQYANTPVNPELSFPQESHP